MINDLNALQRIVAYLRLMREELAADLDRMDRRDLRGEHAANDYTNYHVKRDKLHANDGREGQDRDTSGMPLKPGG